MIIKPNKRRSRYTLEINDNADIIIKTPLNPSQRIINKLISENQGWIKKHQSRQHEIKQNLADWYKKDLLFYRGKKTLFKQNLDQSTHFSKDLILIPKGKTKEAFLKQHARLYLPERCLDIAQRMSINVHSISIRKMTSCWGTCNRQGKVTLNEALIQVPDWVSDYVMVHECAHITHFDHSKQFWALVADYTDQIKEAKNWLKDHQSVLIN